MTADARGAATPPAAAAVEAAGPATRERKKRPRFRKQAILNAAIGLFSRNGFERTAMEDIGQAVGISASALYRHFAGKQEMLVAMYDRWGHEYESRFHGIAMSELAPPEKLRSLIEFTADTVLASPELFRVIQHERSHLPPDVRHQLARLSSRLMDEWADILVAARPGLARVEARVLTNTVPSLLTGVASQREALGHGRLKELLVAMMAAVLDV